MSVYLRHHVFVGDVKSVAHSFFASLKSFGLLQGGAVDVFLFNECEHKDVIQQLLEQLVELTLLIRQQSFVQNVPDKLLLKND